MTTKTVLVTGGSEGIGLGLAARYVASGATVLVTGRDPDKLARASQLHPGLRTLVNDIGRPEDRVALACHLDRELPALDTVINNAGIQRRVPLAVDDAAWSERQAEIDILFAGPIHLNHLLVPVLLRHGRPSTIVNVSSGGGFIPQPFAPMYSACKAAIHSYTMNLRFALANTSCRVVEIIPPAVKTGLAGGATSHGAPLDEFCDAIFAGLATERAELGFGPTDGDVIRTRLAADHETFDAAAKRFPVETYARVSEPAR